MKGAGADVVLQTSYQNDTILFVRQSGNAGYKPKALIGTGGGYSLIDTAKALGTGMDGAYAARTANKAYRTTPLRGLWQHPPYFHDGSAATLAGVVVHYNQVRHLQLNADQQRDLVEYLKSL